MSKIYEHPMINLGDTRTMTFGVVSPNSEMQTNTPVVMLSCALKTGTDHAPRAGEAEVTQDKAWGGQECNRSGMIPDGLCTLGPATGTDLSAKIFEIGAENARDEDGVERTTRIVAEQERVEDRDEGSSAVLGDNQGPNGFESEEIEIASSYGDIQSLGSVGDLDVFDLEQGELSDALYQEWITVTRRKPARKATFAALNPPAPLDETEDELVAPVGWVERCFGARKVAVKPAAKKVVEPARRHIPFGATTPLPTKAQRRGIGVRGGRPGRNPQVSSQINGSQGECTGTDDLPAHAERFRSAAAEVNRGAGSRSKQAHDARPTEAGTKAARRYEDKQRPCFKFSLGTCRFGSECKFSHEDGLDPELGKPQGYRDCRDFIKGECRRGDSCRFSHSLGKQTIPEPNVMKTEAEIPPKPKQVKVAYQSWAAGLLREHGGEERAPDSGPGEAFEGLYAGLVLLPRWRRWLEDDGSLHEEDPAEDPAEDPEPDDEDSSTLSSGTNSEGLTPSSNTTFTLHTEDPSRQDDSTAPSLVSDEEGPSVAGLPEGPEVVVGNDFPRSMPMPDLERQFKLFGRLDKDCGSFRIPLEEALSYIMGESELGPLLAEMKQKADFVVANGGSHKLLSILGTGWMMPGLAGLEGPALTPLFDMYRVKLSHFMLEVEWRVTQDMVLQTEDMRSANKTHVTMVAGADIGRMTVGMALMLPRACPDAPCPRIDWFSNNGRGLSRLYSSVFGALGNITGSAVLGAMHREREEVESRWARAQTTFFRQPGNIHWLTGEACPSNTRLYTIDRALVGVHGYYYRNANDLLPLGGNGILPYIGPGQTPLFGLEEVDIDFILSADSGPLHTDGLFWAFGCGYQRVALSFTLVHNHAHAALTVTDPLSLRSVCASVNNNAAYNIPGSGKSVGGSHACLSLIGSEALAKKPVSERAKWKGGAAL